MLRDAPPGADARAANGPGASIWRRGASMWRTVSPIGWNATVPRSLSRNLAPIGATFALLGLYLGAWTVTTPEIERALGGGPGRMGLVLTGALVLAAFMNTLGGALAERRGTSAAPACCHHKGQFRSAPSCAANRRFLSFCFHSR